MKEILLIFFISLSALFTSVVQAQDDCMTDPPLPPRLLSVSVLHETGSTVINWSPSPSTGVAAYIIYSYKSGDAMPVDTVRDPLATSWTIPGNASKYFSVSYVVSSMRLPRCTSAFSNVVNTIFCEAVTDTCNNSININWNAYPSYPFKVNNYSVLVSENGGDFVPSASTDQSINTFSLKNFQVNTEYCIVVRAILENGTFSGSNKACTGTNMKRPPAWINADFATIDNNNRISLSFTIDPVSELSKYSLERKNRSKGPFREIAVLTSTTGNILYTDYKADPDSMYHYRLSAVNGCGNRVSLSNISSNIVPVAVNEGNDIKINWNPYLEWAGGISGYFLFANTGNGYIEIASVNQSDTTYLLKYSDLMYQVSGKNLCFIIKASEGNNPHGISGKTESSFTCIESLEKVTVPNLFTPDGDLINDHFRPVLSFNPDNYKLIITDSFGKRLFESIDPLETWDGTVDNKPLGQGVYIWYLRLTTPSGNEIKKTGTVTILRK